MTTTKATRTAPGFYVVTRVATGKQIARIEFRQFGSRTGGKGCTAWCVTTGTSGRVIATCNTLASAKASIEAAATRQFGA